MRSADSDQSKPSLVDEWITRVGRWFAVIYGLGYVITASLALHALVGELGFSFGVVLWTLVGALFWPFWLIGSFGVLV